MAESGIEVYTVNLPQYKTAHMANARDRILEVADRLFRSGGLEAVTTRRIAGELDVTAMALYKHFRDKDTLVDALVAHGFALWEERLAAAVAAPEAERPLERSLYAYRDFALDEPRYFELLFLKVRPGVPDAREALRHTPSPAFGAVISRVQREVDAGRYRLRDPTQLVLLMWSLAHGLIALHFTGRFSHDHEAFRRIYDGAVATMFAMLST